jgi:hypothetical protein
MDLPVGAKRLAVLPLILLVLCSCDSAMQVYQDGGAIGFYVNGSTADGNVSLIVKPGNFLVGMQTYAAHINFSNRTKYVVLIKNIDLVAGDKHYCNNNQCGLILYPAIREGGDGVFFVSFDLSSALERAFKSTVQLRVYYECGGKEGVLAANLKSKPFAGGQIGPE